MNDIIYHIVFDVHSVLFKPVYYKIIRIIIKMPGKLQLLGYIFNPLFICALVKRINKYGLGKNLFNSIVLKYPALKTYENTCIQLASAQRPNHSIFELIKYLCVNYKLHIFSNMNKEIFINLKGDYPTHFAYFDKVLYWGSLTQWHQKPHQKSYITLLSMLNTFPCRILFIDNARVNISAAQRLLITTHRYTTKKSLIKFLKKLAIKIE